MSSVSAMVVQSKLAPDGEKKALLMDLPQFKVANASYSFLRLFAPLLLVE